MGELLAYVSIQVGKPHGVLQQWSCLWWGWALSVGKIPKAVAFVQLGGGHTFPYLFTWQKKEGKPWKLSW